jgi:thiol-disulfide isomerase/thioredoxin
MNGIFHYYDKQKLKPMKKPIAFVILFLSVFSVKAQIRESPSVYFNGFQKYTHEKHDVDSAIYFAKKLTTNRAFKSLLMDLLHNSFGQSFIKRSFEKDSSTLRAKKRENDLIFNREILRQMIADTNTLIRETVRPVYLWNTIQENSNDKTLLERLTNEFIAEEFLPDRFYDNRTGRYGLMIYKIINAQQDLKPLATKLFDLIKENVKINQVSSIEKASRNELDRRANFRYLYAHINFLEANGTEDIKQKEVLLKNASDFSPDLMDKSHKSAYFYDMAFVQGKESYEADYLSFMDVNSPDKKQVLSMLLKMALVEPKNKERLKIFYEANKISEKNFKTYWEDAIDESAKNTPAVSMNLLDETQFSIKNNLGKWTLMDFWGTWCSPCREEHPDLQSLYDYVKSQSPQKLVLVTVACRDKKEDVLAYMNKKKFTFPVVMADDKIENDFAIQGYPTKILISPKGKYVVIPFGVDWKNFIQGYCDL